MEKTVKVLIADDSEDVRRRLRAMLAETMRIQAVEEARDGVEALRAVRRASPDVVILDLRMPRLGGIEVLRRLKRRRRPPRVVVLTNYGSEYRAACRELGAEVVLDKAKEFERVPEFLQRVAGGGRPSP
jgi:CheY-like chemotaxis protein